MELFSLISQVAVHETPGMKIISKGDFTKLKKASEILDAVKQEALDFKKSSIAEAEVLKETASKEGFDEGLNKFNALLMQLEEKIQTTEKNIQAQIIPIALKAAKKILGEELRLNPERIVDIVLQALKPVVQHQQIKIYANKEDIAALEAEKDKIKSILQQVKSLAIEERDDVEKGGCLIETESGIINAQLENQWRSLELAFKSYMENKKP